MNVLFTLLFVFQIFFIGGMFQPVFSASSDVQINATVPGCGDGVIESGEQCDSSNLGGAICVSVGFGGGSLSCNANCTYNTSQCISASTPSSGGGGGGGGGGHVAPVTSVIFSGRAYPGSKVTLLKDAQIVASVFADPNAAFNFSLSGLSSGNYIFGIYSEDGAGRRSSLITYPVSITSGTTIQVGGIFLAPTIMTDKSEVKRGDNIAIFGQSAPNSEITISVNSDEEFFNKVNADKNGVYLYNFDTSPLEIAQHFTKSKAFFNGEISFFSKAIGFFVGAKNIFTGPTKCPVKADLNDDCKVNLVDFSIAAYWYKRPLSIAFKPIEVERLNGDGKIDLVDFSIMAYYWTG